MNFAMMFNRALRAAKLENSLYEEVEADPSLNNEALLVVVIAGLLSGIGAMLAPVPEGGSQPNVIFAVIGAVVGYYIWSLLTWLIGTKVMGGTADFGEMARTLGYAYGIGAIGILAPIPVLGGLALGIAGLWQLVAGVVATRQALDFSTGKAVITTILGWLVMSVVVVAMLSPLILLAILAGAGASQ